MHEGDGFSVNTLRKNGFHLLTDWSGNVQAGQFWQMENALDSFFLLLLFFFFFYISQLQIAKANPVPCLPPGYGHYINSSLPNVWVYR